VTRYEKTDHCDKLLKMELLAPTGRPALELSSVKRTSCCRAEGARLEKTTFELNFPVKLQFP